MDKKQESFTVYNGIPSARKPAPDLLKQDSIQRLINTKGKYTIEPPHPMENYNHSAIVPQSDNTMVATIHHKIIDVLSNEFLGIMTIDINLDAYSQLCNNLVQGDKGSVFLINSNDQVMYASDKAFVGKTVPSNLQQRIKQTGVSKGEDITFSKTLSEPLNHWKLVKIIPSRILFSDTRKTAFISVLVGIGVGVFGVIMVSLISYKITRPIQLLTKKVQSIEGGNMNVHFGESRTDEIGYLEKHMKEMMDRINLYIDREYKLEIENKNNQFRVLKSQVNPHFLFNALQSIGAVALRSNSPKVYQLVASLSKMMRYSIQANEWVSIKDEVNYIQAYLSLQKERFRNKIHYSIHIDESIFDRIIPSMILQPLVENFFKHVYDEGYYDAQLMIKGEMKEELLHFTVENNGPSLTPEKLLQLRKNVYSSTEYSHKHIGLKNIYDRLILSYGEKASLVVGTNQGEGFLVEIQIPLDRELAK